MYIAEIKFKIDEKISDEDISDSLMRFLGALRMNGQIFGSEFPIAKKQDYVSATVMIPEIDSLNDKYRNEYVSNSMEQIYRLGLSNQSIDVIGKDPGSGDVCSCRRHEFYILYTNYLLIESPLHCGNCFGNIPLYKIPHTSSGEYHDIVCWQSDYQACDNLQMNCTTGERFGLREMSRHDSSLTKQGLKICEIISKSTKIPTYYYLYRHYGRSKKAEMARRCPSCNQEWLIKTVLHELYDFRCDKCHLLSNIALNCKN